MRKVLSEYRHQNKYSNALLEDIGSAKIELDKFCIKAKTDEEKERGVNGFVQEVTATPFGFKLISHIQLKIWQWVIKSSPIWYVDATGCIIPNLANGKKIYHYVIACNDCVHKKTIPIAEVVTSDHKQANLSANFYQLIKMIDADCDGKMLPKIIITDQSYALIGSFTSVINGSTIEKYVSSCFKVTQGQKVNIKVVMIFCAAHYLKNFLCESKKEVIKLKRCKCKTGSCCEKCKDLDEVRSFLIHCFIQLQHCTTFDDAKNLTSNIHNLFMSEFFDSTVSYSFRWLKEEKEQDQLDEESSKKKKQADFIVPAAFDYKLLFF